MAEMPNSNPLPPATAHMLQALEAFLDTHHFLCDLYPFSTAQLLFDNAAGVNIREPYPVLAYVGESPAGSLVDKVYIYCISCGSWLGWRIIRQSAYHPVIRVGHFVLVCDGGVGIEAVFPM
ncbi:hypothetical protein AAG906_003467 [Vitis piasezkii]